MPKVATDAEDIGEIHATLCRTGRAILGWTRDDLARESTLSEALIKRYETTGPRTASAGALIRETFRKHDVIVEIDETVPPKFYRVTRFLK